MYRDLPLNNPIYVACQLVILEVSRFVFLFSLFLSLDVYGNFGLTFIFLLNILKCACSFSMHKANVVALRRDSWTLSWVRFDLEFEFG